MLSSSLRAGLALNLVLELHSIKHEQLESEKVKVGQVVKIDKMAEINGDSSLATNSSLGFIGSTAAGIIHGGSKNANTII